MERYTMLIDCKTQYCSDVNSSKNYLQQVQYKVWHFNRNWQVINTLTWKM